MRTVLLKNLVVLLLLLSGIVWAEPAHPRLLFSNSDIPALQQKVQSGWLKEAFAVMVANADSYMQVPVNPYPLSGRPSNGMATAGRAINERVNTLALTGILLEEPAYIDHAIAICMAAIAQTNVDDFESFNPHIAVGDAMHAYAIAYDWLYPYMTPAQRTALYDEIVEFMDWMYDYSTAERDYGRYEPVELSCNHNSVIHGAMGLAGLVVTNEHSDEVKRAALFVDGYFQYARDETGYNSEGIDYYAYGSLGAIPFSVAYERAGFGNLIDGVSKNYLIPEWILRYMQPWGSSVVPMNDSPERMGVSGGMMELISRGQDRVGLWTWLKMYGPDGDGSYGGPVGGYIGNGCTIPYIILFADEKLELLSPEDAGLPLGKFFERGSGAFRSSWQDDAALATFTCGFDQHRGHNQRDEGSFTFSALGEYFVIDPGYYPSQTRAHNCVLVNGVGQDRERTEYDTHGVTIATRDFGSAWYMKGDATDAYRDSLNLKHAIRQFLFVEAPQPYIIVSDDIEGPGKADFSWLLHTAKENDITMGSAPGEFYIRGRAPDAAVCLVKFLSPPKGLSVEETDLSEEQFESRGGTYDYRRYFREMSAQYTGKNPKYTAILVAAESVADLPKIETRQVGEHLVVNVVSPHSRIVDQIIVTDRDMDFYRLENVCYLHEDMTIKSNLENAALWFDHPSAGGSLDMPGEISASNSFDVNGYALRAPNTRSPATFDGTIVVSDVGAGICMLYATEWYVAGFDVGNEIMMRPHRALIDLTVSNLVLRAAGNMQFRTLVGGNDTINLAVEKLSGNGQLSFGTTTYTNDVYGKWGLKITDPSSEFSGTVELSQGELTFDNGFALSNATFSINEIEDNRIVLSSDVFFASVKFGETLLAPRTYTAGELNAALKRDRFSGDGTLTVISTPVAFYLQGEMKPGESILDKSYWFDERSAGNTMADDIPFFGNRFDVNGEYWRAPNTARPAVFDGTIVVDAAGSGILVHYAADLQLAGGVELDNVLYIRPHRPEVSTFVADLKLGSSGELLLRTLKGGRNRQHLTIANLSGTGVIGFGTGYGTDKKGIWTLSITDTTPDFSGSVSLFRGELTFASDFTLPDATFSINPIQANRVVLAHNVGFKRVTFGAMKLTNGTYSADELNAALGTNRFSGPGSITIE